MVWSLSLIGPRCCGKTSVGKDLAAKLGHRFVDADQRFVEAHGEIKPFVDLHGWEEFRKRETEVLGKICKYARKRIVLAPGGGAVAHNQGDSYREQNRKLLRASGSVYYLIPSESLEDSALILAERLLNDPNSGSSRPALTQENDKYKEMLSVLKQRDWLYKYAAHKTILTGRDSIAKIADEILNLEKNTTPEEKLLRAIFDSD